MYSIRSCMCSPESNIHYWQAPRASCPGPWCPPTSQPSSAAPSRGIGIGWALGEAFALFLSFSSFIKELPQIFTHAGSCCLKLRSFARRPYLMKCFLKQSSHLQRNQLLEEKSMTMQYHNTEMHLKITVFLRFCSPLPSCEAEQVLQVLILLNINLSSPHDFNLF